MDSLTETLKSAVLVPKVSKAVISALVVNRPETLVRADERDGEGILKYEEFILRNSQFLQSVYLQPNLVVLSNEIVSINIIFDV